MLEDFTMEKKSSSRSGQPPVKGNGTESKKNPDTVGSKIFPKTSRRREPVNSQNAKYETNRKPVPQKNKSIDKRPKPRGQYYGCGKEDSKVAEDEVECGGIYVKKQIKKLNLNHLLNFHYASRDSVNSGQRNRRANPGGWGRYASKSLKHKYNKEQFLQANCQFVVKADGDYSSYMMNPDMLVDWELIEQIQLRSAEVLSCPICLYPPVAAKMTRCGHVFCWSCILHYLALSDKSWRKCPICYDTVVKNDLKSVIAVPHTSFSVGDIITLHLMKRKRGSLIALPVNQSEICPADKLLSVSEKQVDTKYSKLLLASSQEVFSIIDKEMQELTAQLEEVKGCPEACFVEQALELLKERAAICRGEQVLFQQNDPVLLASEMSAGDSEMFPMCEPLEDGNNIALDMSIENSGCFVHHPLVNDINQNFADKYDDIGTINHQRYESVSSEGVESEDGAITVEDIELPNTDQPASATEGSSPKDFYFYQAADGQHVYLHALNIRMLVHFYGGLKDCPLILTGQIVEKETGSMTEELRQRLRYLQHLPVTCQFEVVELQLRPPIVNRETIHYFQDQLEIRKRRRLRRARDERRREKRINEQEKKHWGRFPAPDISIDSHYQFPSCGVEVENVGSNIPAPTPSSSGSSPAHSYDAISSVSSTLESVSIDENPLPELSTSPEIKNSGASSGPSFAQMLRSGKSKWPSVSEKKKHKEHHMLGQKQNASVDSDPEYEGYTPLKQSFGDAIAEAMERAAAMAAASTSAKDEMQDDPGSSGKKKKKQKQKLLFATGMACISK